ncbi:DoxX family protein [Glycomyces buryatensis]|uniref:DoxX family protein n=1 Tax=Glycomyces buryatensis TaxID=2570927 RepID=A0A4S8PUI8_9ACTN|nr:DoxX family protein [Glycomyces buryatensis]THV33555.1 DoxX family protein [Glycomyces buryatensis]
MTAQTANATFTVIGNPTTTATVNAVARTPRRGWNITLWAFQVLLSAFFVWAAVPKLAGAEAAVAGFEAMGAAPWFRILTGAVELAGAIGLVIPRLSSLAAGGLALVMVCASYTNLVVMDAPLAMLTPTAVLCALFVAIAWARRAETGRLLALLHRR